MARRKRRGEQIIVCMNGEKVRGEEKKEGIKERDGRKEERGKRKEKLEDLFVKGEERKEDKECRGK